MSAMDAWITAVTFCVAFLLGDYMARAIDRPSKAIGAVAVAVLLASQWWVLS